MKNCIALEVNGKASVVWFSSKRKPDKGAYLVGDDIRYTDGTQDKAYAQYP